MVGKILATELQRVHLELARQLVHGLLQREGALLEAGSAGGRRAVFVRAIRLLRPDVRAPVDHPDGITRTRAGRSPGAKIDGVQRAVLLYGNFER
jgi:hypothetical protein